MSEPLTPAALDELERLVAAQTTAKMGAELSCVRADYLLAVVSAAPALIAAARDLAWHEDRHGTRAEQEAEDAELAADLARIDALSDEECKAELAAEGIDYDAARKKFDTVVKLCAERADLKRKLDDVTRRATGYEMECAEIDQVLGRALGYPLAPGSEVTVCTGEHTPASLATETAREVESLRAERDTWRMLGTALADHLYAHNSVTHPNVLTVITAISRYSRDKPLESATPITIEAPYCTHPAASKVVSDG